MIAYSAARRWEITATLLDSRESSSMARVLRKNQSQQLAEQLRQHSEEARLPDGELFMTEAETAMLNALVR